MTFLEETFEKFLDGEENLTYYAPIYAGDKITVHKKLLISKIKKKEPCGS